MLCNRVRDFRDLHGLSQEQLAERSGVNRQVIGNLEAISGYNTTMSTAVRLCRYFNCELGRLFYIDWTLVDNPDGRPLEEVAA